MIIFMVYIRRTVMAALYLLEVEVLFRRQQLKLLPLLLWSSQQQVVKHMVVPEKAKHSTGVLSPVAKVAVD